MRTPADNDYQLFCAEDDSEQLATDDLRPRSRIILQELAQQKTENDSFAHIKTKVSASAIRGIGVLIVAVLLSAIFLQFLRNNSSVASPSQDESMYSVSAESSIPSVTVEPTSPARVLVHVAGAVNAPGVYELEFGQRAQHAIDLAGGAKAEADLGSINLAQPVTDGQQIYVPVVGEQVPVAIDSSSQPPNSQTEGLININTATAAELEQLPRVGPATAQKIVEYRETKGKFTQLDDLLAIPGIGEKTIQNFEGLVTFS